MLQIELPNRHPENKLEHPWAGEHPDLCVDRFLEELTDDDERAEGGSDRQESSLKPHGKREREDGIEEHLYVERPPWHEEWIGFPMIPVEDEGKAREDALRAHLHVTEEMQR